MKQYVLVSVLFLSSSVYAQTTPPPCIITLGPTQATSLQASIDQVASQGRGSVCLTAGTYQYSTTISLKNEVVLRGVGANPGSVIIKRTGSNTGSVVSTVAGTSGAELRNLTIDGGGVAGYGVLLYQSYWNTLEYLHIDNVSSITVGVVQTSNTTIVDSYLGPGLGSSASVNPHIWVDRCNESWIARNEFIGKARTSTHEGDGGVAFYGSSNMRLYDNYLYRAGSYVASASGVPSYAVDIWGNEFQWTNEWPVDVVEGSYDVLISSNVMENAFHGAIVLWNVHDVEVSYNTMNNNNTGGHVGCQGINLSGTNYNLNIHNNSGSPLPLSCVD